MVSLGWSNVRKVHAPFEPLLCCINKSLLVDGSGNSVEIILSISVELIFDSQMRICACGRTRFCHSIVNMWHSICPNTCPFIKRSIRFYNLRKMTLAMMQCLPLAFFPGNNSSLVSFYIGLRVKIINRIGLQQCRTNLIACIGECQCKLKVRCIIVLWFCDVRHCWWILSDEYNCMNEVASDLISRLHFRSHINGDLVEEVSRTL